MKVRQATAAPDLADDVIAILLDGWGAQPPVPCENHGFSRGFIDLFEPDGPGTLWHRHEVYLRQVARAWRWQPKWKGVDGTLRFYGEHIAAGGSWHDDEP